MNMPEMIRRLTELTASAANDRTKEEYSRALEEYERETARLEREYEQAMTDYPRLVAAAKAKHEEAMKNFKRRKAEATGEDWIYFGNPKNEPKLHLPSSPVKPKFPPKPQPPVQKSAVKPSLPASVEPRAILSQYDLSTVERSAYEYYQAVRSVADKMLDVCDDIIRYEATHPEDCPTFDLSTSNLDSNRQNLITRIFDRSVDGARLRLLEIKNDAVSCSARIDEASTIRHLTAIENEPRANFFIVVEKCARIVNEALSLERNRKFIANIVEQCVQWSEEYARFTGSMYRQDDRWHRYSIEQRLKVERMLLPLIEHGFENGAVPTDEQRRTVERGLELLRAYRDELHDVYVKLEGVNRYWDVTVSEAQEKLPGLKDRCWNRIQDTLLGSSKREQMFLLNWIGGLLD